MKRIIPVILSFLLIFNVALTAGAVDVSMSETGDKVVFTDENWAYEKANLVGYEIDAYIGSAAEVSVPWSFAQEYITTIGEYAFNNNTTVIRVDTTAKIKSIGSYAFNGCTSLEEITLYDSLTQLGTGCFYGDSALRNINLNDTSITAVSEYCFAECGLYEVELPESCESIGAMAFYNCADLKRIVIPDSVTAIAESAFTGCDNLVIYGSSESYAIAYAQEHGIEYVILTPAPDPVTITFFLGDADGDGIISILDTTLAQRVLAKIVTDDEDMIILRVTGGNDELDISHATEIQRYCAGLNTNYPIGTEMTVTI